MESQATHEASGLAGEIRSVVAGEAEQFDLAGYTEQQVNHLVTAAFGTPLPCTDMVKITLVVGAGKLARQKYEENLQKYVFAALRTVGFQEDKGASCLLQCAGTYKSQHDTGKNIKTVIVFPRVASASSNDEEKKEDAAQETQDESSPEYMAVQADITTFQRMVGSKCESWSQKKRLLKILQDHIVKVEELGQILMQGVALSDQQLALYELSTTENIQQKIEWLTNAIKGQVEAGNITQEEKNQLLSQLENKLSLLNGEIAKAEEEGKEKKVQKLQSQRPAIEARMELISGISPISHHPLKREEQIREIYRQYVPLLEMVAKAKGRLLTVAETCAVGQKDQMEETMADLEQQSRGWFESDEEFQRRTEVSKQFRVSSVNRPKKKK